jgi:hypothetical protein
MFLLIVENLEVRNSALSSMRTLESKHECDAAWWTRYAGT